MTGRHCEISRRAGQRAQRGAAARGGVGGVSGETNKIGHQEPSVVARDSSGWIPPLPRALLPRVRRATALAAAAAAAGSPAAAAAAAAAAAVEAVGQVSIATPTRCHSIPSPARARQPPGQTLPIHVCVRGTTHNICQGRNRRNSADASPTSAESRPSPHPAAAAASRLPAAATGRRWAHTHSLSTYHFALRSGGGRGVRHPRAFLRVPVHVRLQRILGNQHPSLFPLCRR